MVQLSSESNPPVPPGVVVDRQEKWGPLGIQLKVSTYESHRFPHVP